MNKQIKIICPKCKSDDIEIDLACSGRFIVDKEGFRGWEDRGGELYSEGMPYCSECGHELTDEEIVKQVHHLKGILK